MLGKHLMQYWTLLSNAAMEVPLLEMPAEPFGGMNWHSPDMQNETTLLAVQHLLVKHDLTRLNHLPASPGISTLPVLPLTP
jgi:hypothetical protein